MEIIIKGGAKEIATLVLAVQEQQEQISCINRDLADSYLKGRKEAFKKVQSGMGHHLDANNPV